MTIAAMQRLVLIGPAVRKDEALAILQRAGVMHVDGLEEARRKAFREGAAGGERARRALRYLAETPRMRAQVREDPGFDVTAFVEAVLANQEARTLALEAHEALIKRIERVRPWGAFAFPDTPDEIGGARLWFYECPQRLAPRFSRLGLPWRVIHHGGDKSYIVVLSPEEPPAHLAPVPRTHLGAKSLDALLAERAVLEVRIDELDLEREALSRRLSLLARDQALAEDDGVLALAGALADGDPALFALKGYVASNDAAAALEAASRAGCAALIAEPAPGDRPPTLLRPAPAVAAGADLLRLYQLPGAREWDPSGVVFFSFAAFFALILSDAGYALILLAAAAVFWPRLGRSALGRRLRQAWLAASALALVWGIACGSWFGAAAPQAFLARLQVVSLQDYPTMMAVSVGVGALHLAIANIAAALAAGFRRKALAPMGWVVLIAAGCAYGLWREAVAQQALIAAGLGAGLIVAGAPGIVSGLLALSGVSKLFGDVLSYLRLFALGLASASLALAFNGLAADARAALPGVGEALAIAILVLGHALNLALAIVGGVVHGLRLNFIEFLSWGVAEEGRPFVAFARRSGERA